jgi:polyisoprenoid-binding protein YceI
MHAFVPQHAGMTNARMLTLALALLGAAARAEPVLYEFDPAHTFVHFELMHFGTSTLRGRIGPVGGVVQIDRAGHRGELSLRIPTAGVSTGIPVFDARIRAADLLASEAFPEAYFVATNFRFDGDSLAEVRGEFTLRGTSQPLSLRALRFACRSDAVTGAAAVEVCGGDFEGSFLRSDFGLSFALPFVANRVRLLVQVEGRRR